jgi:hypothetical protein
MYIHVGTAWRLKGDNPGLKGFRCVQLHNVWWQQIPIPHCSWEKVSIRQDSSWNTLLCVFLKRRQGGISLFSLVMDTSSLSILYIIISLASFLLFAKGLSPFESLEHVADTRSVFLVVDDISSCSSLYDFNFGYEIILL